VTTVHLTNAYHPTSGGIRTFYDALLAGASREHRRVVLIVPGAESAVVDVGRFARIHYIEAPRAPAFDRRYRTLLPYHYVPLVGTALARILEHERPRLVEICDKYTLPYLAAMLRKGWHRRIERPALVGLSSERLDDNLAAFIHHGAAGRRFARWYLRHIYGPPFDVHVANSEYTAAELRSALPDRAPDFIRVCPMGVDIDDFGPQHASRTLREDLLRRAGGAPGSVLVAYAGRLSPEKNLPLLIEAMRLLASDRHADYRLVAAGEGPLAGWLAGQAIGPLAGRVHLCGNLTRSGLAALYASCDVFAHPNPREPFGIGPLEAMASATAVVVPDAGGVREYATEANAWLAAPDAASFAAAIRAARAGRRERVAAALETAHRFRWNVAIARYFSLYDDIVSAMRIARAGVAASVTYS
jgi:glycosyltransferase involved in cell wall biosynthesis